MFVPIHLLKDIPNPDYDKTDEYKERWYKGVGEESHKKVIELIHDGAGPGFLKSYRESNEIPILYFDDDLQGIEICNEEFSFDGGSNFDGINFAYSRFWHASFKGAAFRRTKFPFGEVRGCKFINCLFHYADFYGCSFYDVSFVNCTFVGVSFINCEFKGSCAFLETFVDRDMFSDCLFDATTKIEHLKRKPTVEFKIKFNDESLSGIYKGLKDSYLAGEAYSKYREMFLLQKIAERKFLKQGFDKFRSFSMWVLTGYGVKWSHVLMTSIVIIFVFAFIYTRMDLSFMESLIQSGNAFTTIGYNENLVPFYTIESALGISMFALFVTVLANVWFSER